MPFVKSDNPDDFFENASLTFSVQRVQAKDAIKYRVYFSDPPIVLLSPLNMVELEKWISVSLEGMNSPTDYTYTATYVQSSNSIDLQFSLNTDTAGTVLKVQILDRLKVTNSKGKPLEND